MAIPIKTPGEIAAMRSSGRLAWQVLETVAAACQPGITTRELDELAQRRIAELGAHPALLGYTSVDGVGFPGVSCICVNEEVVHAVPSDRIIREGDAVTIDIAVRDAAGWFADVATTVGVGESARAKKLISSARWALLTVAPLANPGVLWSQLVAAVEEVLRHDGCTLVPGYCGHGIGRALHEPPRLCFGGPIPADQDVRLEPGMVLTIEPIVVEGVLPALVTLEDGWTVVTGNRAWAAHEERTIAITRRGCEILT